MTCANVLTCAVGERAALTLGESGLSGHPQREEAAILTGTSGNYFVRLSLVPGLSRVYRGHRDQAIPKGEAAPAGTGTASGDGPEVTGQKRRVPSCPSLFALPEGSHPLWC